jgi:hypothetical protein
MKAIICEYPWQTENIEQQPDALLVSVSPDVSYELSRRGLAFKECSEFCRHKELWAVYPEFVHNFLCLTRRLDEILWEVDPRFSDLRLPIFDRLGYMLKIDHDQAIYYAHLLRELLDIGVDTIACADNGGPAVDQFGLFEAGKSIIPDVVRAFGTASPALELQVPPPRVKTLHTPKLSFGQPKMLATKIGIESMYNAFYELNYLIRSISRGSSGRTRTVLSVGCKEVDALNEGRLHTIRLLKYHPDMEYVRNGDEWPHVSQFISRVRNDKEINRLLYYRDANLTELVLVCIGFLADKLELVLKKRAKIYAFLERTPVEFVVFQTMAPSYLPNVIVQEWCRERKVPFACWMHGGYGAYQSLQGYDVTDYRLSPRHLVYGQILANLPADPDWILHQLNYANHLEQIHVAGSPFFEKLYSKYSKPENQRKKILFCIGNYYTHNQFYFGHNRANSELSIWNAHKRILEVLVKFQDTYDICVKDYPDSTLTEMWLSILRDMSADKIRYITNERPFNELLVEADLHAFTWVSTTFFQSMYTVADICLFDDSDITKESRDIFEKHLIFSPDLEVFCARLENYLETGKFYIQNKNMLRDHFIDWRNKERRTDQFESMVNSI